MKLDSIQLRGRSGREYGFGVYLWGHHFKPASAIYIVMERRLEPDGIEQYLPVYLGEAADLSRAIEDHPRAECFQAYLANTIAVLKKEDSESRKMVVEDLLGIIKPPCNQLANIGVTLS